MTVLTDDRECAICGNGDVRQLVSALVEWLELPPRWEDVDRCKDRAACRERLGGRRWPVRDAGESPLRPVSAPNPTPAAPATDPVLEDEPWP